MKELSIKQKAKAYDEAIERANNILEGKYKNVLVYNHCNQELIEHIFPELKESEDERKRVQPQPKQEWNEDDERMLDEMYNFFDTHKVPSLKHDMNDYANFIKSLKDRYT